ncbi:hypothetical protein [Streptomyces sp. NRRL F-5123]|uniref:hypothetical protein n=1 Tax=Streptomyces sp. NRRL F-5123 TaxID=1463856 RepID=UPI000694FCF5|nr:hypothetical protein [Streptomyces sp. NRRL F-5123]
MFNKKSAAIAWLVGGISLACAGVGHAVAAGAPTSCSYDSEGNKTCVTKSESSYTSEDGHYHLQQQQDCTTVSRPVMRTPQLGVGQQGTTRVGAVVGCSNSAPAPEGFKAPDFSH